MFYEIKSIAAERCQFDLSDFGGPIVDTVSVIADRECLINSCEFFDYNEEEFQTEICEVCGTPGCSSGSWVSLRKIDNTPVFVPAINAIKADELNGVYGPPKFLLTKGPIKFSNTSYLELRNLIPQFPDIDNIRPIEALEVLGAQKIAIPGNSIGNLYEPAILRRDVFLAVSQGDLQVALDEYQSVLDKIDGGGTDGWCISPNEVVELHLDLPDYPSWRGFGRKDGQPILALSNF